MTTRRSEVSVAGHRMVVLHIRPRIAIQSGMAPRAPDRNVCQSSLGVRNGRPGGKGSPIGGEIASVGACDQRGDGRSPSSEGGPSGAFGERAEATLGE